MKKILLVDDQPAKYDNFVSTINSAFPGIEIFVAIDVKGALEKLYQTNFDIVVVDIKLPAVAWKVDDGDGGLKLLEFFNEDPSILIPTHVIGITQNPEVSQQVRNFFSASGWLLIEAGAPGADWETRLTSLVKHSQAASNAEDRRDYDFDVCFVTALQDPEHRAVLSLPIEWDAEDIALDSVTFARVGSLKVKNRPALKVAAVCAGRMNSVNSGLLTLKAISHFRPKMIVMVGICAGMPNDTNYGDCIMASPVWDWSSSKWTKNEKGEEEVLPDPDYKAVSEEILSRMRILANDVAKLSRIRDEFQGNRSSSALTVHIGPCASGPIVIADGATLDQIKRLQNRKVLGLEMEAYGVYVACLISGKPKPNFFSLKAVCDFADPRKNSTFQPYAAYTSARVAYEYLMRFGVS